MIHHSERSTHIQSDNLQLPYKSKLEVMWDQSLIIRQPLRCLYTTPNIHTNASIDPFQAGHLGRHLATTSGEVQDGQDGQDGQDDQDGFNKWLWIMWMIARMVVVRKRRSRSAGNKKIIKAFLCSSCPDVRVMALPQWSSLTRITFNVRFPTNKL